MHFASNTFQKLEPVISCKHVLQFEFASSVARIGFISLLLQGSLPPVTADDNEANNPPVEPLEGI